MADRCEVEILGMVSATSFEWGAGALDAINTYYGRLDIPIGALKEAGFLERSDYSQHLAQNFPNDVKSASNEDGVNWGSPITSGRGSAVTVMAFDEHTTRYLKVVQTGILSTENRNTSVPWMMRELSVFLETPQ